MSTLQLPQTIVTRDAVTHRCQYDFSAYRPLLPRDWLDGLESYFNEGIKPGSFLLAVLNNDFLGAVRRLHPNTLAAPVLLFHQLTELLLEGAPSDAWGGPQAVARHLAKFVALQERLNSK